MDDSVLIFRKYKVTGDPIVLEWVTANRFGVLTPPPGVRVLLEWQDNTYEGYPEEIIAQIHLEQVRNRTISPKVIMWAFDPCAKVLVARIHNRNVEKWLALNTLPRQIKYLLEDVVVGFGVPVRLCSRMLEKPQTEIGYPMKPHCWTMRCRRYNGGIFIGTDKVLAFTGLKIDRSLQKIVAEIAPDLGYRLVSGWLREAE
jgi:hypothetical protein